MDDGCAQGGWTDAQWGRIQAAVAEEAGKARVAASVLPIYGPLPPGTQVVPSDRLVHNEEESRLEVDDVSTIRLVTIQGEVAIKAAQMQDPDLAGVLFLFRRTANMLARVEDSLVFNGRRPEGSRFAPPGLYRVTGEVQWQGLLAAGEAGREPPPPRGEEDGGTWGERGERLVVAVVDAISTLERSGYGAPVVCVLGDDLFRYATTPNGSLVMPRDRIEPFLGGPLVRSSALPPDRGVVVSLAGNPIDIAVAQDMTAQFLQISREPRYIFRVYERLAVRIKDDAAVVTLAGI